MFASFLGFHNFSSYLSIIFWLNMWLSFWQWSLQFLSGVFPLIRCNFLFKQIKSDYQIFQSNIKIPLSLPLIISFWCRPWKWLDYLIRWSVLLDRMKAILHASHQSSLDSPLLSLHNLSWSSSIIYNLSYGHLQLFIIYPPVVFNKNGFSGHHQLQLVRNY